MPKLGSLGQGELRFDTVRAIAEEYRVPLIASARSRGDSAEYLPFTPRPRQPPKEARRGTTYTRDGVTLHHDDALKLYATWPEPVCIISDGAYGVAGFPGKPDLVFPSRRKVIFVHGCFWHGHEACRSGRVRPQANAALWGAKLDRNKERDAQNLAALAAAGWTALVVWACEMRDEDALSKRLTEFLGERGT